MDFLWVNYRGKGWRPSDDLMFPEQELGCLPESLPASSPPKTTGGKRKSKAIPIVRPDGTIATPPGKAVGHGRDKVDHYSTGVGDFATSKDAGKRKETALKQTLAEPGPPSSVAIKGPPVVPGLSSSVEDPFTTESTIARSGPVLPDPNALPGSPAWWAWMALYSRPALFPPPSCIRPQSWPGSPRAIPPALPSATGPFLSDGPLVFAQTSTGGPAEATSFKAANTVGEFVGEGALSAANGRSLNTAADTHARRKVELKAGGVHVPYGKTLATPPGSSGGHYADLYVGFGGPGDQVTPRASNQSRHMLPRS